ncbi:MAG: tRNA epoxyqueuosine(34) reductase QueG [Candidatus Hydrogenedentales bacterium]
MTCAPRPPKPPDTGRVSRYAWGRDYHRVLRKPLRALAAHMDSLQDAGDELLLHRQRPGAGESSGRQRAGLGWIGKEQPGAAPRPGVVVLSRRVIVTTLPLPPDPPIPDFCGTCTRCLDACPTNAFVEPGVVDSRLCLSWHSIENRGEIPPELHPHFGDWVFGCDLCQEVCPWNRDVPVTGEPDFHPRADQAHPSLERLDSMDEAEFLESFAGTPIMRAKLQGMQRNARIAQENLRKEIP